MKFINLITLHFHLDASAPGKHRRTLLYKLNTGDIRSETAESI